MGALDNSAIGVIGLGKTGKNIAKDIKAEGADTYAYYGLPAARYEIARAGISLCSSAKEIAEKASKGHLILTLENTDDLEEILMGEGGLISNMNGGITVIDYGKMHANNSARFQELVTKNGGSWINAFSYDASDPAITPETQAIMKCLDS